MKRLNPLYVLLLCGTFFIISIISLNNKKALFEETNQQYLNLKTKAKEYKTLLSDWKNEKNIEETLEQILRNKTMQTAKITKTKSQNYIALRVESNESRVLDYFLNKVLNKPFIIKKLELNKNYIDLQIGIKWWKKYLKYQL